MAQWQRQHGQQCVMNSRWQSGLGRWKHDRVWVLQASHAMQLQYVRYTHVSLMQCFPFPRFCAELLLPGQPEGYQQLLQLATVCTGH
jgi:hypothetical protein